MARKKDKVPPSDCRLTRKYPAIGESLSLIFDFGPAFHRLFVHRWRRLLDPIEVFPAEDAPVERLRAGLLRVPVEGGYAYIVWVPYWRCWVVVLWDAKDGEVHGPFGRLGDQYAKKLGKAGLLDVTDKELLKWILRWTPRRIRRQF